MLKAEYRKQTFKFKRPSGTSRGILNEKNSWFIILYDDRNPAKKGIGECSLIEGLSPEDLSVFEDKLEEVCFNSDQFSNDLNRLQDFPAIRFGLEMAFLDLKSQKEKILFPSEFTSGQQSIPINGLVWMGDFDFMEMQIKEKLKTGFTCVKLKIGAIDFEREIDLLKSIRQEYSANEIEIRVDANGAFHPDKALEKLKRLSEFDLHSIEQPIRQGQWEKIAELCNKTPLPIALDEELIGVKTIAEKQKLIDIIQPQYIILKPSLLGGFKSSQDWIDIAENNKIGWWVTSALESNIGLNAIAQWTYTTKNPMPQGLGTGQLYINNFESPLQILNGELHYLEAYPWKLESLFN
jgi:o-succinylbenzoate synthase